MEGDLQSPASTQRLVPLTRMTPTVEGGPVSKSWPGFSSQAALGVSITPASQTYTPSSEPTSTLRAVRHLFSCRLKRS